MIMCKRCSEFLPFKDDLCVGCYDYLQGETRRKLSKELGLARLFLLMDIAQNPGITFRKVLKNYTSDGSLSSSIYTLQKKGLVTVLKEFHNNKPRTSFFISKDGLEFLEKFEKIFKEFQPKRFN